jgi:hypothetical protein
MLQGVEMMSGRGEGDPLKQAPPINNYSLLVILSATPMPLTLARYRKRLILMACYSVAIFLLTLFCVSRRRQVNVL